MSELLLTLLKYCLLALLYLFFFRVLRAVWTEVSPPRIPTATADSGKPGKRKPKRAATKPAATKPKKRSSTQPTQLAIIEPDDLVGVAYDLGPELTVGRAPGCSIVLDQQYVSQVHCRLFMREDTLFVEDLGSTNGTWINGTRAQGQLPARIGDKIQTGNVVMEVR